MKLSEQAKHCSVIARGVRDAEVAPNNLPLLFVALAEGETLRLRRLRYHRRLVLETTGGRG